MKDVCSDSLMSGTPEENINDWKHSDAGSDCVTG